jgi:hypothetical protein
VNGLINISLFSSPLVREFLSIDNPRNASVHDDDENETNGMNNENSESLVGLHKS